jgi:hypothetical protein
MRVKTVYVKVLRFNLPPREQRAQMKNIGPEEGKIKILVDSFVCDEAQLIINTLKLGKLPLEFDIKNLKMTSIGPDGPMHFDADLTNPKPVGNVLSSGSFGPWQGEPSQHSGTAPIPSTTWIWGRSRYWRIRRPPEYGGLDNFVGRQNRYSDFRVATAMRMTPLYEFHAIRTELWRHIPSTGKSRNSEFGAGGAAQ